MYDYIEFIICYGEGTPIDKVKSESRKEELVFARQLIMWFSVKYNIGSYAFIGSLTGGRDHATISHALKQIQNRIDTDVKIFEKVNYYSELLKRISKLTAGAENIIEMIKPLETKISELEQRCINLNLQVSFLKTPKQLS